MQSTFRSCVAELVGTFTLTFVGAGAIITNGPGPGKGGLVAIALAHGLALSMAVYATGHISGGHINPAVTLAMLATKDIGAGKALGYIAAQLVGSSLAALALKMLLPGDLVAAARLGATLALTADGLPVLSSAATIAFEAVLTFFLITTIFSVAVDKRGPKNVYGFAIGLTIAFDILCGGPWTGASMNPARSFGPALVGGHWTIHQAYWIGPILGGVIAGLVYDSILMAKEESS